MADAVTTTGGNGKAEMPSDEKVVGPLARKMMRSPTARLAVLIAAGEVEAVVLPVPRPELLLPQVAAEPSEQVAKL